MADFRETVSERADLLVGALFGSAGAAWRDDTLGGDPICSVCQAQVPAGSGEVPPSDGVVSG
jgi:hypothetical protein